MKRVPIQEFLDDDAGTPAEVDAALGDLRFINHWFGGVATTRSLIEQVSQTTGALRLSLLEVAAGSGDVPSLVRSQVRKSGIELDITLLDRARSHMRSSLRSVVGDARALPFREAAFDLVSCSLFAHHLAPDQFAQFVTEGLRICRKAVLINDLIRDPVHLMLVYGGYAFYRSRLTRHDSVASVRQAYTPEEMHEMLKRTASARVEISRHYLFRMGVIAWKI